MSGNLAALVTKFGEELQVKEIEIPQPKEGEIVIEMLVRPVNPADIFSVNGVYPGFQPASLPASPGLEGMGVVHALGNGVSGFNIGERVVPILLAAKSFQQFICVPQQDVVKLPEHVTNEAGAQLVVNPFTVWGLLEAVSLSSGQFFIQSAASSEVGRMLIIAGKARGLKSINLVRRPELVEELLAIGADHVICTETDPDFPATVNKITDGGAHAAFDCVAGEMTTKLQASLRRNSKVLVYGVLSGVGVNCNGLDFIFKNILVGGFWLATLLRTISQEDKKRMIEEVFEWMKNEHFGGHVGEKFALKDISLALKASLKAAKPGKVLLYNTL